MGRPAWAAPFSFAESMMNGKPILAGAAAALLLAQSGCSAPVEPMTSRRVGAPLAVSANIGSAPPFSTGRWSLTALRPAAREEELEILLFASKSPAFAAMVIPADRLPFLEEWALDVPVSGEGARQDLSASFAGARGWKAIPIEISIPVLVYRKDLWAKHNRPAPDAGAEFEKGLDLLKERDPLTRGAVGFTPDWDRLFWSLAWSGEGGEQVGLYSPENAKALRTILSWNRGEWEGRVSAVEAFMDGKLAALITDPLTARILARSLERESKQGWFAVAALPGSDAAKRLNFGLCIVASREIGPPDGAWSDWCRGEVGSWAFANGREPAFGKPNQGDQVSQAVAATPIAAKRLPKELIGIAREAIEDAAVGAVSPEEALRRGEARWRAIKHE
jgi:hypothetical protein